MKKLCCFSLLLMSVLCLCAQKDSSFTDGGDGVLYKIIPAASQGKLINAGGFFEFSLKQTYRDSLLYSSEDYANQVAPFDSAQIPLPLFRMFSRCHEGDSVVVKVLTDSAFRGQPIQPPFEKGQYFVSAYKIVHVFYTKSSADSAAVAQNAIADVKIRKKEEQQLAVDEYKIKALLDEKGLKAVRTPSGVYIRILQPGTGAKATPTSKVKVNYTGRTIAGKVFDSNTDPAFNHVAPYDVDIAAGGVIPGWLDALLYFSKGTKAVVYVPSPLGYGIRGRGADIGPNEIMIFDMEVVSVSGAAKKPATPKATPAKKTPVKKVQPKSKTKAGKK